MVAWFSCMRGDRSLACPFWYWKGGLPCTTNLSDHP
nr:MAG TPA: hypothetical protein [Caudoviricetes sp.]